MVPVVGCVKETASLVLRLNTFLHITGICCRSVVLVSIVEFSPTSLNRQAHLSNSDSFLL